VNGSNLYLHEQALLLVLRDEDGTLESKAGMYRLAIGGAILSELLLQDRIEIEAGKKKLVRVKSELQLGEPVLDEALARLAGAKRRRGASAWVSSLAGLGRLRHRIAEGLCRRGVLKDDEDKLLLLFTRKVYPTIDPGPERQLVAALGHALQGPIGEVDPRTAIVLGLAHATGSLRAHFDRKTLARCKPRIEAIVNGDLVGGATADAVQAAQAAAMAAITAATTTAIMASTVHVSH
jgi:hypothetical protein